MDVAYRLPTSVRTEPSLALGYSSLRANALWLGGGQEKRATIDRAFHLNTLPRAEQDIFCGFPLTQPCLLRLTVSAHAISLVMNLCEPGSSLTSSPPIAFSQASEHDLWIFTSLACCHLDASNLCHSEYPKWFQMWHIILLGMWQYQSTDIAQDYVWNW